jgi:20S proteasome subunit beta 2
MISLYLCIAVGIVAVLPASGSSSSLLALDLLENGNHAPGFSSCAQTVQILRGGSSDDGHAILSRMTTPPQLWPGSKDPLDLSSSLLLSQSRARIVVPETATVESIATHNPQNFEDPFGLQMHIGDLYRLESSSNHELNSWISKRNHFSELPSTQTELILDIRPSLVKITCTGTTIAGVCGADFVVIGADTRTTNGVMVADRDASKLHTIAPNMVVAGAGTAADLQHLTRLVLYTNQLWNLQQYQTIGNPTRQFMSDMVGTGARGKSPPVVLDSLNEFWQLPASETIYANETVASSVAGLCQYLADHLYRQQGTCQANLIVAGMEPIRAAGSTWSDGQVAFRPVLQAIHPHGSVDDLSFSEIDQDLHPRFVALGSGGLAATAVLERGYHPNLSLRQSINLVSQAIRAGIRNDLGSGSHIDLCVMQCGGEELEQGEESVSSPADAATGLRNSIQVRNARIVLPEERAELNKRTVGCKDSENAETVKDQDNLPRPIQETTSAGILNDSAPTTSLEVNGFGNVPFQIKRSRVIARSNHKQMIQQEWDVLLGL